MPVYDVPTSLSPSRVDAFTKCPLQFRFASIDKLPEPPSAHLTKGSLVHRALEILFTHRAPERTAERAAESLAAAIEEYRTEPEFVDLDLSDNEATEFFDDCRELVDRYLTMEDPTTVRDVGLELRLEAATGDLTLRGIIDRLELDADGELVVTDYKTGRSPGRNFEQQRLGGVHFYSFLCESVLGRRPRLIRLMYLRDGVTIESEPTEQSVRFITTRTTAIWKAVATACTTGDFRPRRSALCAGCSFRQWCPEFGGDPDRAVTEVTARLIAQEDRT